MPLAELNHDVITKIAQAMPIEDLQRLRVVNKEWLRVWIKRQNDEKEYTIQSRGDWSSAYRYHRDAATSLHNVGVEMSRDLLQEGQQTETTSTLSSLKNVSTYRVGWDGYGEWNPADVAILFGPIDQSRSAITTLEMTIPWRSVISFANAIGSLPNLASLTMFFYTGCVDSRTLEKMIVHLTRFINGSSDTLKKLSIGADQTCEHLDHTAAGP